MHECKNSNKVVSENITHLELKDADRNRNRTCLAPCMTVAWGCCRTHCCCPNQTWQTAAAAAAAEGAVVVGAAAAAAMLRGC